jgi:hypothetical protein
MFVKNLAFAVFGHDTLKGSSVTGGKCNAKQNATPKPSLDSTKLLAIKGILIIYTRISNSLSNTDVNNM